ncbi:hypothetical protein ABGV43_30145 [Paenibacillus amylolyticus]|uniref:hypothetical protein n=1 Tax=Paenibacillus amylolyticus TaxID=1451 RepID=UPI003241D135
MRPVQYKSTQSQPIEGMMQPIPIREFRGLNNYDPYSIEDSYFTELQNMSTDDYPALSTRPGYKIQGTFGSRVLGMGVWKGRELHAVFNDGTWRRLIGNAWTTLASGLNTAAEWSFTNFDGNLGDVNLIGCNGVDSMRRYNGSSVSVLSGAPSNGKYITTYQNRLWCAVGNELWSSALDQPQNWNQFAGNQQDSYRKTIESSHGEDINMLSGSLYRLTIGMPSSIHLLMGGQPSDFNSRVVTDDEGVANNNAVTAREGALRFMHKSGIYEYSAAALPDKGFSELIRTFYSNVSSASAAGSDGLRLLFSTQGGETLVYDPRIGTWTRWLLPTPTCYAAIGQDLYYGTASGQVLKLGGTLDSSNPIAWKAVTKPFTNGSIAQKQRWLKMWIVAEMTTGSVLRISLSSQASGESWDLVNTITASSSVAQRIIIPVRKFALENTVRIKLEGTGWIRLHEITRQVRQLPLY